MSLLTLIEEANDVKTKCTYIIISKPKIEEANDITDEHRGYDRIEPRVELVAALDLLAAHELAERRMRVGEQFLHLPMALPQAHLRVMP